LCETIVTTISVPPINSPVSFSKEKPDTSGAVKIPTSGGRSKNSSNSPGT